MQLTSAGDLPWSLDDLAQLLVEQFSTALSAANMEPAHVKVLATGEPTSAGGSATNTTLANTAVANWVASDAPVELSVASQLQVHTANVLVNARVHGDPDRLADAVKSSIAAVAAPLGISCQITNVQHFRPGRPEPTHRYLGSTS